MEEDHWGSLILSDVREGMPQLSELNERLAGQALRACPGCGQMGLVQHTECAACGRVHSVNKRGDNARSLR